MPIQDGCGNSIIFQRLFVLNCAVRLECRRTIYWISSPVLTKKQVNLWFNVTHKRRAKSMMNSITRVEPTTLGKEGTSQVRRFHTILSAKMKAILLEKGVLFYTVGFLLGRAVILEEVSPFAVAFLATMWFLHREKAAISMLAVLLGALTLSVTHSIFIFIAMLLFLFLAGIFKQAKNQEILIPVFVLLSTAVPRIFLYSIYGQLSSYEWMLLIVEGVLGTVLLLIFMQSVPLIAPKRYKPSLKNEEIVCMIILIASILTGMIGWQIYDASVEQIFSRYFVLVLAFIAGAAIGSTVGVVAGLILSLANVANLYQMSLLAFSGLLGGLLKEGKKPGEIGRASCRERV